MPGVVRKMDMDSGHGCFPPRMNIGSSSDVMVDNKGVHRKTDKWLQHCCPKQGCHDAITSTASETVFANNLGIARINDKVSCGSTIKQGSSTVFIG